MKTAAFAIVTALLATSAQAQDPRLWAVETPKDAEARLWFGQPDTDDLLIAFTCVRGSGQVVVASAVERALGVRSDDRGVWYDKVGIPAPWPVSVTLTSGAASATLRGRAHMDEAGGGSLVTAEVSTRAPAMAQFRKSGVIALAALGDTVDVPPAKASMVRKFLGACK